MTQGARTGRRSRHPHGVTRTQDRWDSVPAAAARAPGRSSRPPARTSGSSRSQERRGPPPGPERPVTASRRARACAPAGSSGDVASSAVSLSSRARTRADETAQPPATCSRDTRSAQLGQELARQPRRLVPWTSRSRPATSSVDVTAGPKERRSQARPRGPPGATRRRRARRPRPRPSPHRRPRGASWETPRPSRWALPTPSGWASASPTASPARSPRASPRSPWGPGRQAPARSPPSRTWSATPSGSGGSPSGWANAWGPLDGRSSPPSAHDPRSMVAASTTTATRVRCRLLIPFLQRPGCPPAPSLSTHREVTQASMPGSPVTGEAGRAPRAERGRGHPCG